MNQTQPDSTPATLRGRRGAGAAVALVVVVTLALFVLAFLGALTRESYQFARAYGAPVEATLGEV